MCLVQQMLVVPPCRFDPYGIHSLARTTIRWYFGQIRWYFGQIWWYFGQIQQYLSCGQVSIFHMGRSGMAVQQAFAILNTLSLQKPSESLASSLAPFVVLGYYERVLKLEARLMHLHIVIQCLAHCTLPSIVKPNFMSEPSVSLSHTYTIFLFYTKNKTCIARLLHVL